MKIQVTFFAIIATALVSVSRAAETPNFVVFLADDLGWGDLGCYGHPVIQSPNLDKFAKEGVRFTQAYSSCGVCSPSRSSILTGRTPYRNGVWRWIPDGSNVHLRTSEITIPELLKPLGYQTIHSGKWHLNGKFNQPDQPQPNDHGYDWWMATQNNASPSHKNPKNFVRNGEDVGPLDGFSAPLVVDEAIHWLKNERNPNRPFFMTVWTHEPHLPIESDPEFMKLYAQLDDADLRQHHGNVTQLDYAFGKLMKVLDEQALGDNTFVIFTSDNGPEGKTDKKGRTRGSTGGLRGRKRDSHEGGIRVPAIVRWPGKVDTGIENSVPIIGSDIFSTVLDIAGIDPPKDRTIDGVSILPALAGQKLNRTVPLFWRTHIAPEKSRAAMRIDNWKIVADSSFTNFQLFDIEKDWQEQFDLATSEPEKLAEMKSKFLEVWDDIEAEGPSGWWKNAPPERKKKNGKRLADGKDETGDWDSVKGGTVKKSEFGYLLTAEQSEAFAVKKLAQPLRGVATYRLKYRTATSQGTKNACFCFGTGATNSELIKAGTMIGRKQHGVFNGNWNNIPKGDSRKVELSPSATFDAKVKIDLENKLITLTVDQTAITHKLSSDVNRVTHIGIYAKGTNSEFTMPEKVE